MTLNTHSWMEEESTVKLERTVDYILNNQVDVIALQEVNQSISESEIVLDHYFCHPEGQKIVIKANNYGYLLVKKLREKGLEYYWSWTFSHIGYDIYEEGSAILAKKSFEAQSVLVSSINDIHSYRTRRILLGVFYHTERPIMVASCHFSWWSENPNEGFYYEWHELRKFLDFELEQIILLGDFNAPANHSEAGYSLVTQSFKDAYLLASKKSGEFTVDKNIDGWKDNKEKLRIDFVFLAQPEEVTLYQVIFDGRASPVVSDHFGVLIEFIS